MQGQRQDLRRRVEHGDATGLELLHVLGLEHQVPAVHRRLLTQRGLDLGRVEADQHRAVHIGHTVLVTRVVAVEELEQYRVLMAPVGQLALVQFLKDTRLDLGIEKLVRRHHQIVARVAGEQLGFQGFVGVEGVPGDFDAGLRGKILGHGWQDIVRPVVHPQLSYFGMHGAGQQRQCPNADSKHTFQCGHGLFPRVWPSDSC
ncbi:hypothetical protein D3C81_875870 [compost metagenome]